MAIVVLCVMALLLRFVPHVPNVVPMAAMALYAGSQMDKRVALWFPLVVYIVSDLVIGMHDAVFFTWGSVFLVTLLGMRMPRMTLAPALGGTLAGTLLFFVISNFGVWMVGLDHATAQRMYPLTAQGLLACYTAALPFLVNSLIGNTVFMAVLMGVRATVRNIVPQERARFAMLLG